MWRQAFIWICEEECCRKTYVPREFILMCFVDKDLKYTLMHSRKYISLKTSWDQYSMLKYVLRNYSCFRVTTLVRNSVELNMFHWIKINIHTRHVSCLQNSPDFSQDQSFRIIHLGYVIWQIYNAITGIYRMYQSHFFKKCILRSKTSYRPEQQDPIDRF